MRSVWQSAREWAVAVATAWFAWSIAVLTGVIDAAHAVFPGFTAPRTALIGGYALAFVCANVKAFHDMRLRGLHGGNAAGPANDLPHPPVETGALEWVDAEQSGTSIPADHQRDALRRLGLVNELVSRYLISNYAVPLQHDETGCVIRTVVAANDPTGAAELTSDLKAAFTKVLGTSSLERWLVGMTTGANRRAVSTPSWVSISPNTGYITTRARGPVGASAFAGSVLSARATLQVPTGLRGGPTVLLIIDLMEQANPSQPNGPRLRLSLGDLHALVHDLARTAIDELADALCPVMLDRDAALVGPNFELSFGDRSVDDLVSIPDSFQRPSDAQSVPWANINTPEEDDARDPTVRDEVIREGLASMLRQNGYDGFESDIAGLPDPAPSLPRHT